MILVKREIETVSAIFYLIDFLRKNTFTRIITQCKGI